MERITNLTETLRRNVIDYYRPALRARTFFLENSAEQVFGVVSIAEDASPHSEHNGIVVLARLQDDRIIIEEDTTDHPLWEALQHAGIPREKIVLAYLGEEIPAQK